MAESQRRGFTTIESVDVLRKRNHQLQALAGLGQSAIRARGAGLLLDEVVRVTAQTLGVPRVAVFEILPEGCEASLRASVGWDAGVPPPLQELLADKDATAMSIRGRSGSWGMLVIPSARPRLFRPDDLDFLQAVTNVVALFVERGEAEAAEHRENETLQTILDHIPVLISFWDPEGGLSFVNREWERVLGWTLEEARGIDLFAELYPDRGARDTALEFIGRSDRRWMDFRLKTRHGEILDTTWIRFWLSDGTSLGFGLDITKRKETERALADSEGRFTRVFRASPVALGVSTMREGRIIDVNESWLELFGYELHEVIGRLSPELGIAFDPKSRNELIREVQQNGMVCNYEMRLTAKTGEMRDLIVSTVSIVLAGEEPAWISVLHDITERRQMEAERDRLLASETVARAAAEAALERLRRIESITDTALQSLDLDELLEELLGRLREALHAAHASVALIDGRGKELYLRSVSGTIAADKDTIRSPLGHGVSGRVAADGRPRIVHDLVDVDLSQVTGVKAGDILAKTRSVVAAPLRTSSRIIGVVTAASPQPAHFNDDDLRLLLLVADRVAPAVERGRLIETVHAGRERLKALSARLLTAQEEERRRVAGELHDELGQVLTAVKINLQSVDRAARVSSGPADLSHAIASVDQAMERVRDLALDLRPSVLDDLGLSAALRWYADRFARRTGMEVHFSADAPARVESSVETACFRVAQEALTNVARHARARNVWIELHIMTDETELRVRDDGAGFDVTAARERAIGGISLGLLGMEERVSALDGDFDVQSVPGKGTEVLARFPISGEPIR